jgi:hypothetical protein
MHSTVSSDGLILLSSEQISHSPEVDRTKAWNHIATAFTNLLAPQHPQLMELFECLGCNLSPLRLRNRQVHGEKPRPKIVAEMLARLLVRDKKLRAYAVEHW